MYTHPYTTSASIRHLTHHFDKNSIRELEENLPGCLQQRKIAHNISFNFFSKAFYLSRYCGALHTTLCHDLLSGTKRNYLSPAVDFQRLL